MAIAKKKKPGSINFSDLTFPTGIARKGSNVWLSQSLLLSGMQCDRNTLYNLNRWEASGKDQNFFFGSCCHELMDNVYSSGKLPTLKKLETYLTSFLQKQKEDNKLFWLNAQSLEYYKTIILNTMDAYFTIYEDDFAFEFIEVEGRFIVEYNVPNLGIVLLGGKRDGLFKQKKENKRLLFEHKTKGTINEESIIQRLAFDFQNLFYIFTDNLDRKTQPRADGCLYNIIRKTQAKQGKSESLKEFGSRLKAEIYKDPDHFFKRYEVLYSDSDLKIFEFELQQKIIRIMDLIENKRPVLKNEANCDSGYPCDFLKACSSGTLSGYRQRKFIQPELK